MKLYQKDMFRVNYNHELINGLTSNFDLQYIGREALINKSFYYVYGDENKHFTSNNPLVDVGAYSDSKFFKPEQLIQFKVNFKFIPFAKYETYPTFKRLLKTKWPEFSMAYKKGKSVQSSLFNYDYMELAIGKDIELVTYNKYLESYNHLKDFIKFNFNSTDIKLKDVKSNFLNDYDYYLKTQKGKNKQGLSQSTINKAIQRFRKTLKYAISEGYLEKDPFIMYSAKVVKKHVVFLTKEELLQLEKHQFNTERIQSIKELFIFCCYTGLAFKEMSLLKKSDIITGFDSNLWIVVNRSKTDRDYKVPLLPRAQRILERYNDDNSELLFPKISNQKFNEYLKEIAGVIGLSKNLTHHMARKTFASTVLLYNDVPMEIVSELLGHAEMSITQAHYGKVVKTKVSEHMKKLSKKLNKK
jgi:site-specific recombinase XerD